MNLEDAIRDVRHLLREKMEQAASKQPYRVAYPVEGCETSHVAVYFVPAGLIPALDAVIGMIAGEATEEFLKVVNPEAN